MFRSMFKKVSTVALAATLAFGAAVVIPATTETTPTAYAANAVAWQPGQLLIATINVGQGDGTLIVSPEGKSFLFDLNQNYASQAASFIQTTLGHKNLDYIGVSHYHADHIGGIVDLLKNNGVTVGKVYDRGGDRNAYNSTLYTTYYDYVTNPANNAQRVQVRENDTINMGASITMKVVSVGDPATGKASGITTTDENDNSVSYKITFNNLDYFVGGDLSGATTTSYTDIETAVAPKVGDIEVYRVNHHGSSYSSNQFFVDTLKPEVSVISVGQNSFGHPNSTVVNRLDSYGTVYQVANSNGAAIDGNIILTSTDGNTYKVNGTTYTANTDGGGGTTPPPPTGGSTTVRINEVLPAPSKGSEFVELYNYGTAAVDISGWVIDDIVGGGSAAYTIPAGTTIQAGGYYVYSPSSVFNNTGDDVTLISGGTQIDKYTYGSSSSDKSWYRVHATGNWSTTATSTVTKGTQNP